MADITKTVSVIFGGEDNLGGVVDSVSGKFGALETAVTGVAQPFAAFADGVLKADAALAAIAAGAIVLATAKSIEFEGSVTGLNKVIGDEFPGALEKAKAGALEMSDTYGVSVNKIIDSTTGFVQAGFDINESMGLAKNALDLVIAGDMEAAQAQELLTATLKGFKEPASEAGRLVDILNEVSNKYATDVQQLALGMAGLSPIADKMGFSFEETAGILTPVIEVFRSGDEAAIALKTGLLKLLDDSKPVREGLAALGVSQTDANGKLRSGKDILLDVSKAFQGLDDSQKLFHTQQIVGIDQSARMVEVFDALGKTSEITAVALGSAGSAAKEVAVRLESAPIILERFKVGFENLAIAVGTKWLDSTRSVISGATDIETALRTSISTGTFDPIFAAINEFGGSLGELLKGIAAAMPEAFEAVDFSGLLRALGDLGGSFGDLFDDFDPTDPVQLGDAIQFVVDTIESLIRVTDGMVDAFKPFFDGIVNSVSGFNDLDDASKESAGNIALTAKAVVDGGLLIVGALVTIGQSAESMRGVFDVVIGAIDFMWGSAKVSIDSIVIGTIQILESLVETANTISFGAFSNQLDSTKEKLGVWRESWEDAFIRDAEGVGENLNQIGRGIGEIGGFATDSAGKVKVLGDKIEFLPDDKTVETSITYEEALEQVKKVTTGLDTLPKEKQVTVGAKADETSLAKTNRAIGEWIKDERGVLVLTGADAGKLADTKKTIEENIPKEKQLEIQAKVDIEKIKAAASMAEAAMKFKAEVDIAQIEAEAKVAVAAFESINETIKGTTTLLDGLFSGWMDADAFEKGQIEVWIREQLENQRRALELQEKLIAAQVEYLAARTRAMANGDALIQITGDGLQPEIEAFMWKILEQIQIRANAEGAEFLLGVT